jgi:hypothetical protein
MSLARPQSTAITEPDDLAAPRLRTAGEILDDAWRLAIADAPVLFSLSSLFLVPCFAVVLLVIAMPPLVDHWAFNVSMALIAALLLASTGIGSGACQEFLRRRSDGVIARPGTCLKAALRRGFDHSIARAMLVPVILLGLNCAALPGLMLWMASATVHVLIAAGKGRRSADLREFGAEARFDPAKTAAVVLLRVFFLLFAALNLHMFGQLALDAAESLAGLDFSLTSFALRLRNPTYDVILIMLAWLLLAPFFEASNFLLYLDTRTRQEGLDLLHRVNRLFPMNVSRKVGVALVLLAGLCVTGPVHAADPVVPAARAEVGRITEEVKSADPYPGSDRWLPRLESLAGRLEKEGGQSRFTWFRRRLTGFAALDRDAALNVLNDLDHRLERLASEGSASSTDDLKHLLRPARESEDEPSQATREKKAHEREKQREEEQREVRRDVEVPARRGTGGPSATSAPAPDGGSSAPMLIGGLLLALLAIALLLWFRNRAPKETTPAPTTGARPVLPEAPRPDIVEAPSLWRQAEALAAKGEFLEALRVLYSAVLALLHRKHLVRYETTRTNGEYVDQVRRATEAPAGVRAPFERLTMLFEVKWYGERTCDNADFANGKGMAEEVRGLVG